MHDHQDQEQRILQIPLSQISPDPNQPRRDFSDVDRLMKSMSELGQLQPILITRIDVEKYLIVEGESRYRAAGSLDWDSIQCIIVEVEDAKRRDYQFAANMVRTDLNPFELADEYHRIRTADALSQAQLAVKVDESESTVSSILRLRELPDEIKTRLLPVCREAGNEAIILVSRAASLDVMRTLVDLILGGATVAKLRKALKRTKKQEKQETATMPDAAGKVEAPAEACDEMTLDPEPSPDESMVVQWWEAYTAHAVRTTELLDVISQNQQMTPRALTAWLDANNDNIIAGYRIVTISLAPTKTCYQLVPIGMDRSGYRGALAARHNEHKIKSMRSS